MQAVGEGGSGGFVDQFFDVETSQFTGERVPCVGVAEIGGHVITASVTVWP